MALAKLATFSSTDPPQFCLYLTNFREFPPQIVDLLSRTPITTDGGGCVTIPPPSCPSPLRTTYVVDSNRVLFVGCVSNIC